MRRDKEDGLSIDTFLGSGLGPFLICRVPFFGGGKLCREDYEQKSRGNHQNVQKRQIANRVHDNQTGLSCSFGGPTH